MSIDKPVIAVVAAVSMAVNVWLWTENSVLRDRLSYPVTREQLSTAVSACYDLVTVNRRCLAFGNRVREMIDEREDVQARERWARLWDDEVLSGRGDADKAGTGGPR